MSTLTYIKNVTSGAGAVNDFHVSSTESEVGIVTDYVTNGGIIYQLDPQFQVIATTLYDNANPAPATQTTINGNTMYSLVLDVGNGVTIIKKLN